MAWHLAYGVFAAYLAYIIFDTLRVYWKRETYLYRASKARAQREFYYSVWALKDKQTEEEQGE